ncbi:MAG: hypothetical protein KDB63_09740 [Nocardioidaceae bacterium]|nr:hypothetical protein [Nocardioidaceae bacterium]
MRFRALAVCLISVSAVSGVIIPPGSASVAHPESTVARASGPVAAPATSAGHRTTDWSPNLPADITLGPTAYLQLPTGDPIEVEASRSDARSSAMAAWEPYLTVDDDRIVEPAIAPGQVLCLRWRYLYSDRPGEWHQWCTVRGWRDEHFVIVGGADHVRSLTFDDGRGTSLRDGGRLLVPDLVPGMHVAAVVGNLNSDPIYGWRSAPYWRDSSGSEQRAVVVSPAWHDCHIYRVAAAGTGAFVGDFRHGALPVGHVVVFPAWYAFEVERNPPALTSSSVYNPAFDHHWLFTADSRLLVRFTGLLADGSTYQLQEQRGSSLRGAPGWRTLSVTDPLTTGLWLRLGRGQSLCVRYRVIDTDGAQAWRRPTCVSRPFDDSRAKVRGRSAQVADPYFSDGSATRPLAGGSLVLRGVRRGSLTGYTFTSPQKFRAFRLLLDVPCEGLGSSGASRAPGWPSAAWGLARCDGRLAVRYGAGSADVSGLIVVPPWVLRWRHYVMT